MVNKNQKRERSVCVCGASEDLQRGIGARLSVQWAQAGGSGQEQGRKLGLQTWRSASHTAATHGWLSSYHGVVYAMYTIM